MRSEAKSWYNDDASTTYAPEKTYDGDYTTFYSRKDGDADGNYLKLYLSEKYRIGTVKLTNRQKGCCAHRIVGTLVMLYTTQGAEEAKVINCGERITGALSWGWLISTFCRGQTGQLATMTYDCGKMRQIFDSFWTQFLPNPTLLDGHNELKYSGKQP